MDHEAKDRMLADEGEDIEVIKIFSNLHKAISKEDITEAGDRDPFFLVAVRSHQVWMQARGPHP